MKLSRLLHKARKRFKAPPADPSASARVGAERRRSVRTPLPCSVELLDADRRPADGAVHLNDLSGVGAGFVSSRAFRVGESMGVQVNAGGRLVTARARVRWTRPQGGITSYGLEFEGVGRLDRWRIETAGSPWAVDPEEAFNFLLQAGAAAMAAGVAADWIASDPSRQGTFLLMLPFLCMIVGGIAAFWLAIRS